MKTKSMVIAAGGIGSRLSSKINPYRSKALIEYAGKPLIWHLITSAKQAGIENFFISVNDHNKKRIELIAEDCKINYRTKMTGENFAQVPTIFKKELEYKFLVICGHDPVPTEHIKKLIDLSENYDAITTAYNNLTNSTENKKRIVFNPISLKHKYTKVNLNKEEIPENHIYVRNPYIINQDILNKVIADKFKRTAGYFIYTLWENGGKVCSVYAIMPVEFDIDSEFERITKYLDKRNDKKS